MAAKDDDLSVFLLGALAGVGLGAVLASGKSDDRGARESFARRIRDGLTRDNRKLLNASVGRARDRAPFWKFTVQDSDSTVRFVRVALPKGSAPFGERAADEILAVVRRELSSSSAT